MRKQIAVLATVLFAGSAGGCVSSGAYGVSQETMPIEVTVQNLSGTDVTVYLSSGGSLVRLGLVQLGEPTTFRKRIPVSQEDFYFVLDPVGGFGKVVVADRVPRADAQYGLRLTIFRDLDRSMWSTFAGR